MVKFSSPPFFFPRALMSCRNVLKIDSVLGVLPRPGHTLVFRYFTAQWQVEPDVVWRRFLDYLEDK